MILLMENMTWNDLLDLFYFFMELNADYNYRAYFIDII